MKAAQSRKNVKKKPNKSPRQDRPGGVVILKAMLAKRPIRDLLAIGSVLLAIYILISLGNHPVAGYHLIPSGIVGYYLANALYYLLGWAAWGIPVFAVVWAVLLIKSEGLWSLRMTGIVILIMDVAILVAISRTLDLDKPLQAIMVRPGGGVLGNLAAYGLQQSVGRAGLYIFVLALLLVAVLLISSRSVKDFSQFFRSLASKIIGLIKIPAKDILAGDIQPPVSESVKKPSRLLALDANPFTGSDIVIKPDINLLNEPVQALSPNKMKSMEEPKDKKRGAVETAENPEKIAVRPCGAPYVKPALELLREVSGDRSIDRQEIQNKVKVLEQTFANFGIEVKVLEVSCGPVVTRYELSPAPGVKVSRISSLADDLQLSLAARGLRLEAPIPGKAAIGIEIPNDKLASVGLRNILASKRFQELGNPLALALGEDVAGNIVVAELNEMPHVLVAGATGSGKSVCINAIIMSILYNAHPDEVKLVLIDPKMVELTAYNGIPHLMTPVVTDPKKAARVLKWMTSEMEKRYRLFTETGVRDIRRYNEKVEEKLPFIVVVIDELADLMMVAPGDVEDSICRLAQMARAAGIHLIVSTQRPSVDVITGLIKANIPSRIAFAVSSQIDSRTILDGAGAEKLLGKGDMLYMPIGAIKPVRVQGAFVSDPEILAVVEFLSNQEINVEKTEEPNGMEADIEHYEDEAEDALFWDAVRLVVEEERLSASFLQRKFKVGYSRAARLVDMMEERGIVSEMGSDRKRRVLIGAEELEQILARKRL